MIAYLPVLLFILAAIAFGAVNLILSWIVRPARYDPVKMSPYECGIESLHDPRQRFSVLFYLIAVLFIVFDVETVFLFPWAVQYKVLGWFGFVEMSVFILILVIAYLYAWKKGALEWV
ncbi:MAG: NADH-quinone oxidoreductase subunit A [Acidobacteria bacterium]|nr:NADH-quinone oxidoreductase subunit A [Acidobacteriota bacterium]